MSIDLVGYEQYDTCRSQSRAAKKLEFFFLFIHFHVMDLCKLVDLPLKLFR